MKYLNNFVYTEEDYDDSVLFDLDNNDFLSEEEFYNNLLKKKKPKVAA